MVESVAYELYCSFFEFLGVFGGYGLYYSFWWGVGGRCGLNPVHITLTVGQGKRHDGEGVAGS